MFLSIKSTKTTRYASLALLLIYILYALSSIGMTGLLFSSALGLLSYGVTEQLEFTTILVILSGILYKVSMRAKDGFMASNPAEIRGRIDGMKSQQKEARGVLSSSFAEGFADASGASGEGFEDDEPSSATPMSASSAPAPLPPENFKNPNPGLFKLGEIPTDEKGGHHIDQGTTVLNALNALKPDQVKAMSQDTQQLIETQKSLMGMLGTMKPMLQDGKQLLETFNTMFKN